MQPNRLPALPTPRGEHARQQLLSAALELFGESGVKGTTTREIARHARQNIAAIAYYFGSKEQLYLAVAQWMAEVIQQAYRPFITEVEHYFQQTTADWDTDICLHYLRQGILALSDTMSRPETLNFSKIMVHEQLAPSAAYPLLHQAIAPMHHIITQLLAGYTGLAPDAEKTTLHAHALVGEVLAFHVARETVRLQAGWQEIGSEQTRVINEVLCVHLDFILDGLRTQQQVIIDVPKGSSVELVF